MLQQPSPNHRAGSPLICDVCNDIRHVFYYTAKADDPEWTHHGCRYDPDSISPISYRFYAVDDRYETAFKAAEAKWDTTAAP